MRLFKNAFICLVVFVFSLIISSISVLAVPCEHQGGTANCTGRAICEKCGMAYGELDPNNHTVTEIRNFVPATCIDSGYVGDIYCLACGEMVAKGDLIEPTTDHQYLEWKVIKPSTTEEQGISEAVCASCGCVTREKLPLEKKATTEKSNKKIIFFGVLAVAVLSSIIMIVFYNKKKAIQKENE